MRASDRPLLPTAAALTAGLLLLGACSGGDGTHSVDAGAPSSSEATSAPSPSSSFQEMPTEESTPSTSVAPSTAPTPAPATVTSRPRPTPTPTATRTSTPKATPTATQKPVTPAGPAILRPGDTGEKVRELQARLKQLGWYSSTVVDRYGPATTAGVRGFQAKRGLEANGIVDQHTWDALTSRTKAPTKDELHPELAKPEEKSDDKKADAKPANPAPGANALGLDPRCMTGRVICVSKSSRRLVWVIDGKPQLSMEARFGGPGMRTREGTFPVYMKVPMATGVDESKMPYSIFFSGGQAVHYSGNFARIGYAGASHGCVNVRDMGTLRTLYSQVRVGDKVVVYR